MNLEGSFNLKTGMLKLQPLKYFMPLMFFFYNGFVLAEDSIKEITDQLQIGSEWGKSVPSHEDKNKTPEINYIGEFKTATAFLIKSDGNRLFMGTNSHVIVNDHALLATSMEDYRNDPTLACHANDSLESPLAMVRFSEISKSFPCKQVIGIWPNIDFAIFEIEIDEQSRDLFEDKGIDLRIENSGNFELGTPLTVYGYGHFLNPGEENLTLMRSEDENCRVFTPYSEVTLKKDPDQFSPGKVEVWSFVHGCEISWGDSGSPIFDREGNFIGLVWTGVFPKIKKFTQSEIFLRSAIETYDPGVWDHLNYAVPIEKITKTISGESDYWYGKNSALINSILRN